MKSRYCILTITPTFHPSRSRTICVQPEKYWHCFESNVGETAEKQGGARMGLFERYDAILSWNWNWNRHNPSVKSRLTTTPCLLSLLQDYASTCSWTLLSLPTIRSPRVSFPLHPLPPPPPPPSTRDPFNVELVTKIDKRNPKETRNTDKRSASTSMQTICLNRRKL